MNVRLALVVLFWDLPCTLVLALVHEITEQWKFAAYKRRLRRLEQQQTKLLRDGLRGEAVMLQNAIDRARCAVQVRIASGKWNS